MLNADCALGVNRLAPREFQYENLFEDQTVDSERMSGLDEVVVRFLNDQC